MAQRQPTEKPGLQNAPADTSTSHRRILQFDPSGAPLAPEPPPPPPPPPPPHTASTTKPTSAPPMSNISSSCPAKQPGKVNPKPVLRPKPAILGGDKAKRRIATIRCTTEAQATFGVSKETDKRLSSETQQQQQRENVKKTPRKQDHKVQVETATCDETDAVDVSEPDPMSKTESERLKSTEKKRSSTKGNQARPSDSDDAQSSKSPASNSSAKSSGKKDGNGGPRKDATDKGPGKSREGPPEKKAAQEPSKVRANKENENKKAGGDGAEEQSEVERRAVPAILPASTLQPKSSKTSTLTKQAAEMLQDIQGLKPPTTPAKSTCSGSADATLTPGAGRLREESTEGLRTPARQRLLRDGEGTPRRLIAPKTPDIPTCSPASEAGSESSINMAAHTLMILSRAAIARTGSPLKDSLRQEEAGEKSPSTAKQAKKRKQAAPPSSEPAKKEPKRSSSSKKKEKVTLLLMCPLYGDAFS